MEDDNVLFGSQAAIQNEQAMLAPAHGSAASASEARDQEADSSSRSAKWVILFTSDGSAHEWETAEGTLEQAIAQATWDRRHLNYGRNGFRIVPDVSPNDRTQRQQPGCAEDGTETL